jgi:hypothetical protein
MVNKGLLSLRRDLLTWLAVSPGFSQVCDSGWRSPRSLGLVILRRTQYSIADIATLSEAPVVVQVTPLQGSVLVGRCFNRQMVGAEAPNRIKQWPVKAPWSV